MDSNLLKNLLSKAGGLPGKFRAAMLGGDDVAGKAFRTGNKGAGNVSAGGGRGMPGPMSSKTDLEFSGPMGGPLATDVQSINPMGMSEKLKRLLANMTPEQKAALMAGGAGLGAGGLGGYLAGDSEE
jgi:hypothetical protein